MKTVQLLLFSCLWINSWAAPPPHLRPALEWLYGDNSASMSERLIYARLALMDTGVDVVFVRAGLETYLFNIHTSELTPTELSVKEFAVVKGLPEDARSEELRFGFVAVFDPSDDGLLRIDIGASGCHGFLGSLRWDSDTQRIAMEYIRVKCCF